MQIEVAYVSALQGEREDRPEGDNGNTGCDGMTRHPFGGWIVNSGSESVVSPAAVRHVVMPSAAAVRRLGVYRCAHRRDRPRPLRLRPALRLVSRW